MKIPRSSFARSMFSEIWKQRRFWQANQNAGIMGTFAAQRVAGFTTRLRAIVATNC